MDLSKFDNCFIEIKTEEDFNKVSLILSFLKLKYNCKGYTPPFYLYRFDVSFGAYTGNTNVLKEANLKQIPIEDVLKY